MPFRLPAVQATVPWLAGCWSASIVDPRFPFLGLVVLGLLWAWQAPSRRRWAGWVLLFGLAGGLGPSGAPCRPLSERSELDLNRPLRVRALVQGCWQRSEHGWSAAARVDEFEQDGGWRSSDVPIRLGVPTLEPSWSRCGGRFEVLGYVRPPRVYRNRVRVLVGGESLWIKSPRLAQVLDPPRRWSRWAGRWRQRLGDPVDPSPGVRLARALALGERNQIPIEWRESFRLLGLSHLLVVSGLHLGLAAGFCGVLLVRLRRPCRLLGVVAFGLAYSVAIGPQPSVQRAAAMLAVVGLTSGLRRPVLPANALAVAAIVLLALEPGLIESRGFQLSVAATAGVILLSPGIRRRIEPRSGRLPSWGQAITGTLAASWGAQIATLPWTVGSFHWFSPLAGLWNVLAVAWAAVSVVLSLAWVSVAWVAPTWADLLLGPWLDLCAAPCQWLGTLTLGPGVGGAIVVPWLPLIVAWMLFVAWSVLPGLDRARSSLLPVGALVVLGLGVAWQERPVSAGTSRVELLDVGQGDSLLLRSAGRAILVDGGGWRTPGIGPRVVAPALAALGVRKLDLVVVSHGDRDHCGGVAELARFFPLERIALARPGDSAAESCERDLRDLGTELDIFQVGDRDTLGVWRLETLGPVEGGGADPNARSLVLRATANGRCVLLTGDIDQRTEQRLRRHWGDASLRCDLLKVAHHGSRSSSAPGWLYAVAPRVALISVGSDNRYGHPAPEVLDRLENRGVRIVRTDRDGGVALSWTDPQVLRVERVAR